MEQFEERMLLSISPSNLEELWSANADLARSIERASNLSNYSSEELASATQWVVGLSSSDESASLHALAANADFLVETGYLPNASIWEFDSSVDWNTVVDTLACDGKIDYYYPLVNGQYQTMSVPNDPLFADQWHLQNTGQNGGTPGMDANVVSAWDSVLGTGVVIGIADSCYQYTHPDISTNYRADLSWDFGQGDADPYPEATDDPHGTSVAGVAGGTGDNDLGISGSAPDADMAGLRLDFAGWTDYAESLLFSHKNQDIDIYNNSWGPNWFIDGPGPLAQAALEDGVTYGRGGLGNIYTFAAGNGRTDFDNTSYNGYANSRYTIAVAAIDHNGEYSFYSTPGASVLISGYSNSYYSGITTTDLLGEEGYNSTGTADNDYLADIDYTSTFGGTSSATPLVSGVIALMLEANPNLSYRDVQYILAETAEMNDADSSSWDINGAGYHVSNDYGFGAIDATAAVNLAYEWESVGEEVSTTSGIVTVNQAIPNGSITGLTQTVVMDDSVTSIEWVELVFDASHSSPGDLEVSIISPDGTVSQLTEANGAYWYLNEFDDWSMTSCHHWGEASEGEWTVVVKDRLGGESGTWNHFELKIYGTSDDGPVVPPSSTDWVGLELVNVIPNSGTAITNGSTQHVAPRELTLVFNEGQEIDPDTLSAISIKRAGGDDIFLNLNDESVEFGYIAIGDRPNEIVIRFAETLPDDMYQLTILGTGDTPLTTINGKVFHANKDLTITFNLDLGAQVSAIVPQPTSRDADTGEITQSRNTIEVYFNDDTLDQAFAETTTFYRLAMTNETATTNDDIEVYPTSVVYDPVKNKAILTFSKDQNGNSIDDLADIGTGAFRLRIGNEYKEIATSAITAELVSDVFSDATPISQIGGATDGQSVIISSIIEPQPYDIVYPGGTDELGHRNLPTASEVEGHYLGGADSTYGTTTIYYNFNKDLGGGYYNQITETQKQRVREIFELYGSYLGIDFIEDTSINNGIGLTIATGDLRAINPLIPTGPGGVAGLADSGRGLAIMDLAENWGDSEYNGTWFNTAMHEIGHLIGLGHAYDLPGYTIMGNRGTVENGYYVASAESMYPGIVDIIHGQYIHRPDSIDVDMYKFTLETSGTFSAEIIAERLEDSSLLDSVVTIYTVDANGEYQMIARNDDYYSEDSYVELTLTAGTYYVAISSTGNTEFDPNVACSGEGGTSQGEYDLRLTFLPKLLPDEAVESKHLVDTTGTMFDGDADGIQGGVYDFWFDVQTEANTIFVDKVAAEYADSTEPLGSLQNPYTQIDQALAAVSQGQIVRIVGNREQSFDDQVTISTLETPTDVAVGDFNNDGIPDLVNIAQDNRGDFYSQVHFGIDGEQYWQPVSYRIGTNPTDIKVADLNNDGAEDIIVANSGESTLSLLMNNGDGTFARQSTRFTGEEPVAFELGDLNLDGKLDLIVANRAKNTIGVLLSNSVTVFSDQVTYEVGSLPGAVTVGDINNDGLPDIISINQGDGSISILMNQGKNVQTGNTTFAQQQQLLDLGDDLATGILGDFNEDGTNDLALTDVVSKQLIIMIGLGNGTFDTATYRSVGNNPMDIGIGDSDGDGHLDLFVLNQDDDTVSAFFGLGNGTFGAEQVYEVGDNPTGMTIADADRNGRPDILTANNSDETISILTATRDFAYEIGYDINRKTLEDGRKMEVPKDVTVMIDAGAVFKLREANIDVGSSTQGIDRSEGALQVLGTPQTSVYFTSYYDRTLGFDTTTSTDDAVAGDWGGLVFRNNIDYDTERTVLESEGIFMNYVNNAEFRYGGGQVTVNSVPSVYTPIHLIESRPTITFNEIYKSADAAISADPNSFADTKFQGDDFTTDYDRVGPDIYGNIVTDNSFNGLHVRINTAAGNILETLDVCARFDDTDIVHIIGENLVINSTPGGPVLSADKQSYVARTDSRLTIDPGIIVKLNQARIETKLGAQLIAEGTSELPIVFTSYLDTRYGMGGTFDTMNNNGQYAAKPADWSGLYFGPTSTGSLDNTVIAYGGGKSRIPGDSADFNVVESHQASLRLTNSELEYNQGVTTSDNRAGREGTSEAVIYVKGAQPILVNNTIINNNATAISINANSMTDDLNVDWGRSTGLIAAFDQYSDNSGPLVRENRLYNNDTNGMLIRGEVLTTASIWDDTDIVHVLKNEIVIPNFHTEGGLRLESAIDESLVVKLYGGNAGFTALGTPSEIDDRIGGTLQIIGMPGYPVVLTSLNDDSVGAGVDPWDRSMLDTNNSDIAAKAGDWRSVKLEEYVNDRNVAIVNEMEASYGLTEGTNDLATEAQYIGLLSPDQKSGDDNLRLGFDIHGFIRSDDTSDADVYAFTATAGTEVWFDIDATSLGLDSVIELIDADGNVYARSINSAQEDLGAMAYYGLARTMDRDVWNYNDQCTTSLNDAGMRVVLPGTEGETLTYYLRVSSNVNSEGQASRGGYELQIRLREEQEIAGSTVQKASIRYATNGIELLGLPTNSPLTIDAAEANVENNTFENAQDLGNLLTTDGGQLEVAGYMDGEGDIDWYSFTLDLSGVQRIPGASGEGIQWPAIFDIDYADGMGRPDIVLYVYDSLGKLVYMGDGSNVVDDQPDPLNGPSMDELMRGSFGTADPFIGPVNLLEGNGEEGRYYVAVSNRTTTPLALEQDGLRIEPINSITRVSEDQIGASGQSNIAGSPYVSILPDATTAAKEDYELNLHVDDYTLGDVVLYVSTGNDLFTINPYTGEVLTDVTSDEIGYLLPDVVSQGYNYNDIVMRNDGRLYSMTSGAYEPTPENQGLYTQFSLEDGRLVSRNDDGITCYVNVDGEATELENNGIHFEAMAYIPDDLLGAFGGLESGSFVAVGNHPGGDAAGTFSKNLLYVFDSNGNAVQHFSIHEDPGEILPSNILPWGQLMADQISVTVDSAYQIKDGDTASFTAESGTVVFEYDLGLVATLRGTPKDGETFKIGSQWYEFDSGPVIELVDYSTIVDGTSFTLFDENSNEKTFELDKNGSGVTIPGAIAINLKNAPNNATAGELIAKAIREAANFGVDAQYSDGVISLVGSTAYNDDNLGTVNHNIEFVGDYGTTIGTAITIDATMDQYAVLQEIVNVMGTANANTFGDRIAFPNATSGDFSGTADMTGETNSGNGVSPGNIAVELILSDTADTVASKLVAAINASGSGLNATATGDTITVDGGTTGTITGLTYIGNTLFACDDTGNIFVVDGANTFGFTIPADEDIPEDSPKEVGLSEDSGPTLTLLGNYDGIQFSGLEQGPLNAEGSIYSNMMFGIGQGVDPITGEDSQVLIAIDTDGNTVPVFANGQSTVGIPDLGVSTGLAFSTLDYNLWHVTENRGNAETGHGTTVAPDDTRQKPDDDIYPIIGDGDDGGPNKSFWFGYEADTYPNYEAYSRSNSGIIGTYDLPGGAHGTLTTDIFSLAGYSASDLPILTFNYFLETDGNFGGITGDAGPVTDTARVFVSDNGTDWVLLASNTTKTETDKDAVQMVDGSGVWQQCVVDLSGVINDLTDWSNLRLKFEFTTSGSMGTGDQDGDEIPEESTIKIVAGDNIVDGDQIEIVKALTGEMLTFEYDMGYSLVLPNSAGQAIDNADTLTIDGVTFGFDNSVSATVDHVIPTTDGDATFSVAEKIAAKLNELFVDPDDPEAPPFAYIVGDRIYLPIAMSVETTSASLVVEGDSPDTISDGVIGISILPWMTADEVAAETAKIINESFLAEAYPEGGSYDYSEFLTTVKQDNSLLTFAGFTINAAGPHSFFNDAQPGDYVGDAATDQGLTTRNDDGSRNIVGGNPDGTQYYYNLGAQDNRHEGFYIDDVVIGFAERGLMVTDATPETGFADVPEEEWAGTITEGWYQLTIRTASEYTMGTPYRSLDTNDRNTEGITIVAPAAGEIANNDCFTINDGTKTQTFQFVDPSAGDVAEISGAIRIPYSQGQSAEEIAVSIRDAINNAGTTVITANVIKASGAELFDTWENGSNRVDLFFAASVTGIDHIIFGGSEAQNYNQVAEESTLVTAGDMSGDDVNDIVTINSSDKMLRVYHGNEIDGQIVYTHTQTLSVGSHASDVITTDMNGDGLADLVVSNYGDATIQIIINGGGGYFNSPITIETGNAPTAVRVADLDDDGNLDLVVTSETENAIYVHMGLGNIGVYADPMDFSVGLAPQDLEIGDMDDDGVLDIVTVNQGDNSVSVRFGDGTGNFPTHSQTSVGRMPVALAIGDLNGDDMLDIATANRGDDTITVLLNDGSGLLYAPAMATYSSEGLDPVDIKIADITGDDVNDLGVINHGSSSLTNYMGLGADAPEDGPLFATSGNWNIGSFATFGGPTSFVYADATGQFSPNAQEMIITDTTAQVLTTFTLTDDGPACVQTSIVYDYTQDQVNVNQLTGDTNHEREQGYILISSNEILYASANGIVSDAGTIDYGTHPGVVAPLREINTKQLVPGISITNNLVVDAGNAGILFSGLPDAAAEPYAAVPFGRIVNNTVYDCKTGIQVTENASPTILNNILSNNRTGISVENSCKSTVIGGTVYHENDINVADAATLGNFAILLGENDPLFVDAANNNFYLAENSRAIDSAIDSLEERESLRVVVDPLGIAPSPILAPEYDLYGQQRSDDPSMDTPPGQGLSPFKDRGAIDRIDFTAPTSSLIDPLDNDAEGLDRDPNVNDVFIAYERVSVFSIELADPVGAGIDDNTVVSDAVKIYKNGSTTPLVAGVDYFFRYDTGTNVINLYPGTGLWENGATYQIVLDNSDEGIADIAGNPVRANRYNGMTTFNVSIANFDYGDAPDPTYPTLLDSDGARHLQMGDYYLGTRVTGEDDANLVYDEYDGSLITDARGDVGDDGVVFTDSALMIGEEAEVTITASRNGGYLNAWIDFNADGDWDDPGEQIFTDQLLKKGENTFTFLVSEKYTSAASYARFRYSTETGLTPTGEAPNGEVEDYQVYIVSSLLDFGDAPDTYGTSLDKDGARHETNDLYLGSLVDNELEGRPHPNALGDDQVGTYDSVTEKIINDEDGVEFVDYFVPGKTSTINVTSSGTGFLNIWIDFNNDGNWYTIDSETGEQTYDEGEHIIVDQKVFEGTTAIEIAVPENAVSEATIARFRLSNETGVQATGLASGGEVEDYEIVITAQPRDYGDAPRSYYTRETSESAFALLKISGKNNDILMKAQTLGSDYNDIRIMFVNEIAYGDMARVTFNSVTNTYLIDVDPDATTAKTVIEAINEEGTFFATLDVTYDINNTGFGLIDVAPGLIATTSGGFDGYGEEAPSHSLGSGLKLGTRVDAEINAIPTEDALGDDQTGLDDEDGFANIDTARFVAGEQTTLDFTAVLGDVDTAYLSAWIDFNQDGVFSDGEQVVVDKIITNDTSAPNSRKVTITVPIEALDGETYVRFRLSSQADLDWYGRAPDGEIEDYQIEILKGDASISGFAFQDRDFNKVWDTDEEGRVGIVVYVDLDNSKTLNYDDINGDGIFDIDVDIPTEPYAITMDDDPGTLDTDETGYYEFRGLFGQATAYTVRQITPTDSLPTYPNNLVVLPDGSYGNNDNSYSIFLEDGEWVKNVNFGFFEKSHVTVEDVVVAEGNEGYTDIEITVTLTHSFGADLTFSYQTEDASATDGSPASEDKDYVSKNGTITFEAQEAPIATWTTSVLTTSAANNYDYAADGPFVIWEAKDGFDWEIYLFGGKYDVEGKPVIYQLTDNATDDHSPTVYTTTNLDGTYNVFVAWTGMDNSGSDTEVFLYEAGFNADGSLRTKVVTQEDGSQISVPMQSTKKVTDNIFNDKAPQLSETYLTWWGDDGRSNEIFYYDIVNGVGPQNLTENDYTDKAPIVQGSNIVWLADMGRGNEIFLFSGEYDDFNNPITTQITNNYTIDQAPQIDGNYIVWEGQRGSINQIFVYEISTGTTTQITSDYENNRNPQISGKDVVWESREGNDWEIFHYNIDAGTTPANISQNSYGVDERPDIIDGNIVWRSFNGSTYEVHYHQLRADDAIVRISDSEQSAFYPHITENMAVWRSFNGTNYDIVIATKDQPEVTQTIKLRIIGDTNIETDEKFLLKLQAVNDSWVNIENSTAMITILNDDGEIDFGDAPESYSTLLVDNGARHLISDEFPVCLGQTVDAEEEGRASSNSKGDDNLYSQDEDGVTFTTILGQGSTATVIVNISETYADANFGEQCYIDAWIDFKGEGNWDGLNDKIIDSWSVNIGENVIPFQVPIDAIPGLTNARFRLSSTGGLDYTGQVTGGEVEDYQIEILARPDIEERIATITGTEGDDTFIFTAGDKLMVNINGASYEYDPAVIDEILFDGKGGTDTVIFNASSANETVEMWTNRARFTGGAYTVTTKNVEVMSALAGGSEDIITMYGSAGNDTFLSVPEQQYATLLGAGFSQRADGFKTIIGFGAGGDDIADLYGSAGNDTFEVEPGRGQMISAGVSATANNFRYTSGYAIEGGNDWAMLKDSSGSDAFAFSANPETIADLQIQSSLETIRSMATMTSNGINLAAYNFANVMADSATGIDNATMSGSPGVDEFTGNPIGFNPEEGSASRSTSYAKLKGEYDGFDYQCIVNSFRYVTASAKAGTDGNVDDTAKLYDSQGSDTLTASPIYAKMAGEGYYYRADFFPSVIATSKNGGEDIAILHDSAGDDTLYGKSSGSQLKGSDYTIEANDFKHLNAYAGSGGNDVAEFYGSNGDDTFVATTSYGKMTRAIDGGNSYFRAYSFQTIRAYAIGGDTDTDTAYLYDSALQDLLKAEIQWETDAQGNLVLDEEKNPIRKNFASLSNEDLDFVRETYYFDVVKAYSTSAGDKKDVENSVDFLLTEGLWTDLDN